MNIDMMLITDELFCQTKWVLGRCIMSVIGISARSDASFAIVSNHGSWLIERKILHDADVGVNRSISTLLDCANNEIKEICLCRKHGMENTVARPQNFTSC